MDSKAIRQLMKHKNVVSIGTGIKKKGGLPTGQKAVVVGVKKKLPLAQLAAEDIVPQSIDGKPSDVVEVGEIKALTGNTGRVRPCPGGVSCGSYRITAGTLSLWVEKGGQPKLLSNNHVLADVNQGKVGDPILQPGSYDGGQNPADAIATLETFIPIKFASSSIWQMILDWLFHRSPPTNIVDCALAAPIEPSVVDKNILSIGVPISPPVEPTLGMTVQKNGRTTGLTTGAISQVDVTAKVNMGNGKIAVFTDQFMVENVGFSAGGDSGSAVLTGLNMVGLLFAGSDSPPVTLMNKFSNVKTALGITKP